MKVVATSWDGELNRMSFRFSDGSSTHGWPMAHCFALAPDATQEQAEAVVAYVTGPTKENVLRALRQLLKGAPHSRVKESLRFVIEGIEDGDDWTEWSWIIGLEAKDAKLVGE